MKFIAVRQPSLPKLDATRCVHHKQFDGRSSRRRKTDDHRTVEFEVVAPTLAPGMKQLDDGARHRVDARQVRSLVSVAAITSQRQVVQGIVRAMLLRDDVFDMEGKQRNSRLRQTAVFATFVGASSNRGAIRGVDHRPFQYMSDCCALDCNTDTKSIASTRLLYSASSSAEMAPSLAFRRSTSILASV